MNAKDTETDEIKIRKFIHAGDFAFYSKWLRETPVSLSSQAIGVDPASITKYVNYMLQKDEAEEPSDIHWG